MDVKALKELLKNTGTQHKRFSDRYEKSIKYYNNENDITLRTNGKSIVKEDGKKDPLRRADNRVSNNLHQLLVDQEAGYVATVAPQIDVDSDTDNQRIRDVLGDQFALVINKEVIDAANAGVGWLHYWIDEDNNFRYGIVTPSQITPVYDTTLDNKLLGVLRSYKQLDTDVGKYFTVH